MLDYHVPMKWMGLICYLCCLSIIMFYLRRHVREIKPMAERLHVSATEKLQDEKLHIREITESIISAAREINTYVISRPRSVISRPVISRMCNFSCCNFSDV